MKKAMLTFAAMIMAMIVCDAAPAENQENDNPGLSVTGKLIVMEGETLLEARVRAENVSGLVSARVDVEYDFDSLELLHVSDDVNLSKPGRQNFMGSSVISLHEIVEAGVSEYAVAAPWIDGNPPAGVSGSGDIKLMLFRLLTPSPTTIKIRRDTLKLLAGAEEPIAEWSEVFRLTELEFDPASADENE